MVGGVVGDMDRVGIYGDTRIVLYVTVRTQRDA